MTSGVQSRLVPELAGTDMREPEPAKIVRRQVRFAEGDDGAPK